MNKELKIVDGSFGEGGGQILRTSLSLSMCTGTPVRIENIRAGRRKTGLLRQHLACVRASKEICDAKVIGDELGSSTVEFHPGTIRAGTYDFAIGSAGSTSLLFQTVLPALLMADARSTVSFSGGTHNDLAPSFDFIKHSFIPALEKMGINVEVELHSYGFMPNGGGKWTAKIKPMSEIRSLDMSERGTITSRLAVVTQSGVSRSVAERELSRVQKKLQWNDNELMINQVESIGPGNIISLRVSNGHISEVIEFVGAKNLSAERVAGKAIAALKHYLDSGAAVGEYLCDQLLLPMALGKGGSFTTFEPSLHTSTNILVIEKFLDVDTKVSQQKNNFFRITVRTDNQPE